MMVIKLKKYQITKTIMVMLLIVLGIILLSGCGKNNNNSLAEKTDQGKFKLRIGADSSPFSFQFRVAKAKGIFEKYNIDAEVQNFAYGIDTVNAVVLDQVDVGEGMDYALSTRLSKDSDLRIAAYIVTPSFDGDSLYAVGDDIKSPADFKGKNIAVMKGTANEYVWAQTLKKFGVDPKSVNMQYFTSVAEEIASVQSGNSAAVWVGKATKSKILEIPHVKELGDYRLIDVEMKGYLVFKDQFIKEHPEIVENVLKALQEASDYIAQNPQEVVDIAYQDLKLPKEDVRKSLGTYEYTVRFNQSDYDHLNDIATWSMENGLIKNRFEVKDFLSLDILKKALPEAVTYNEK
jgi:ABC-type nitrate/sulfonate/bicarbonate transport system substrate-binding protein